MPEISRASLLATLILSLSFPAYAASCPRPDANGHRVFPDGAILMSTGLQVNPDGAAASYTPGDHGYTYMTNGVNLIENGRSIPCYKKVNNANCSAKWAAAETGGFGPGTPEFCVFAMEVEPLQPGQPLVICENDRGRSIAGNGKGRPKIGPDVALAMGGNGPTYRSTTTLKHTRDGKAIFVDSASIPGLVVPRARRKLVGAIAWVRYGERSGFAIVNDTGPAFGEGSVALHQLVRNGRIGPVQAIGPIPLDARCKAAETGLQPPFVTLLADRTRDVCKAGHTPQGPVEVRAYSGVKNGVTSIILANVKPPMQGDRVTEELTADRLGELARAAGYTMEKLQEMAACLSR